MTSLSPASDIAQLPPIDSTTGFLPPGLHRCSWAEFERTFVDSAPHSNQRRKRLRALELWVDCLDELLPNSTLWLDGGFVSHKFSPPFDIDVVAKVQTAAWETVVADIDAELLAFQAWATGGQQGYPPKTPFATQLSGLMTHQDVTVGNAYLPRIQPFGGRVDGFIIPANQSASLAAFYKDWMIDAASGASKGFVEVIPDGR